MQCFSVLEGNSSKWVSSLDLRMEADHGVVFFREQGVGLELLLCSGCKLDSVAEDVAGFLMCCALSLRFWCCNPVAVSHCYL